MRMLSLLVWWLGGVIGVWLLEEEVEFMLIMVVFLDCWVFILGLGWEVIVVYGERFFGDL